MKDPKGPVKAYKTPEELAKKHKVTLDKIVQQVKIGTEVEGEHTTSKSGARITALQHVDELPDYYTRLKKVEKKKPMKEETTPEEQYKKDTKYCLLCKKNEKREECSWGPSMWDKYTIAKIHPANESKIHEDHKEIASGKKKDEEGYMARVEFDQIERAVNILRSKIKKGDQQIPAWVQSKITRAADFIDTAAEYMQSDEDVSEGMDMKAFQAQRKKVERSAKRKAEKLSPNRRKDIHTDRLSPERAARHRANVDPDFEGNDERNYPGGKLRAKKVRKAKALGELGEAFPATPGAKLNPWESSKTGKSKIKYIASKDKKVKEIKSTTEQKSYNDFITEVAAWQRKEGKNKEGGLNEKGRKSYERENPGSDLKAPSKKVGNPRRASFCARMRGMKNKRTSAKTARDPNSRINKSLRAWNC